MPKTATALAITLALRGPFANAATPDPVDLAREALIASSRSYRAAPALTDTMTYIVKGPNMDREPKKIQIRLGAGSDASVADALLAAVALGNTFYLTKSDAPGKYVSRPFSGDFGQALASVAGNQSSLFEPVQIALREGRPPDDCLAALRFNLLGPLRIAGFRRVAGNGGKPLEEIQLEADNGREELRLDAKTHLVLFVHLAVQPPGSPSGVSVEIDATFAPRILQRTAGVVAFDPGTRRAVSDLADLSSETLPVGKAAPDFALETLEGRRIALADLKGRAVLVDFWATWCVPCWKTLKETQRLADWASASGLPVTVLAVNTMERFPTEEERRTRVAGFFKSQGLTIQALLDKDTGLFRAFGAPGLPSMVVVGPRGTILGYHQGLFPNAVEKLETELTKAVRAEP